MTGLVPGEPLNAPVVVLDDWSLVESGLGRSETFDNYPPNTRRTYLARLRYLWGWYGIALEREMSLPATVEDVLLFIKHHLPSKDGPAMLPVDARRALCEATYTKSESPFSASTVDNIIAAWAVLHSEFGLTGCFRDVRVRQMLKVRRAAAAPKRAKALNIITADMVNEIRAACPPDLRGLRDRALISFMYSSGGRRRSEIKSIQLSDVRPRYAPGATQHDSSTREGYLVHLSQTKTGSGRVSLVGDAATDLGEWIDAGQLVQSGAPLFPRIRGKTAIDFAATQGLSGEAVVNILRGCLKRAGYDPRQYSPHGMRSGFIFDCLQREVDLIQIARATTHRSLDSLRSYIDQNVTPHLDTLSCHLSDD